MKHTTLPLVAKALGEKYDIQVQISGDQAYTNGRIINLPSMPDSKEAALLARGYIDHESAHIRFTDFSVKSSSTMLKNLTNILEDIRIEKMMGAKYPGCRSNLKDLAEHLKEKGSFTPSLQNPPQTLMAWLCARGRLTLNQDFSDILAIASNSVSGFLGTGYQGLLNLTERIPNLVSTRDSQSMAEEIMRLIQDEMKQQEQERKQPESQTSKNSGSADSSDSTGSSGQGEGNQAEDGESSKGNQSVQPDQGADDSSSGGNNTSEAEGGDSSPEATGGTSSSSKSGASPGEKGDGNPEALREILDCDAGGFGDVGEILKQELMTEGEAAGMNGGVFLPPEATLRTFPIEVHETRRHTALLRARLSGLIQASRLRRRHARRTGNKIDNRVVHRLALHDTRLFLHQEEKTEVNTAIMILVDRSGSMQHQKIEVASKTAFVVAEALDSIPGCFAAVAAFPVGNNDGVASLVRFGERPSPTRFGMSAGGGTPLAQALYWAGVELLKREEPRKILLAVTDGEPDDRRTSIRAIRWLERVGVEPMGLGICEESVRSLFPTHGVVYRVEELPSALFGMLQETLTQ